MNQPAAKIIGNTQIIGNTEVSRNFFCSKDDGLGGWKKKAQPMNKPNAVQQNAEHHNDRLRLQMSVTTSSCCEILNNDSSRHRLDGMSPCNATT